MRIRLRRNRSYWLRDPLTHERFPLSALRSFIQPGTVVYDVGANLGLYTRFCCFFGAAHVVAFEPMTDNRKALVHNLTLGGIQQRVTVLPYALSDVDEEQDFQIDDLSSASAALNVVTGGGPALGRRSFGFGPKTERVHCRRLDSLLAEGKLPPPDVLKVDIEGAERLMLAGATGFLKNWSPRLLIELHGPDKAKEVIEFLCDLGYTCRGKVSTKLNDAGYGDVNKNSFGEITDLYDVQFLMAAKGVSDLPAEVTPYYPLLS
jgi:FkbM family methyltransferase